MAEEVRSKALSVLLLAGLSLLIFTVSPLVDIAGRVQIEFLEISVLILAAAVAVGIAITGRETGKRTSGT